METFILVAVILLIIGGAGFYVYRAKRRGRTCIGCPCSGNCGKKGGCSCNETKK